jgi:hypothetical protein
MDQWADPLGMCDLLKAFVGVRLRYLFRRPDTMPAAISRRVHDHRVAARQLALIHRPSFSRALTVTATLSTCRSAFSRQTSLAVCHDGRGRYVRAAAAGSRGTILRQKVNGRAQVRKSLSSVQHRDLHLTMPRLRLPWDDFPAAGRDTSAAGRHRQ